MSNNYEENYKNEHENKSQVKSQECNKKYFFHYLFTFNLHDGFYLIFKARFSLASAMVWLVGRAIAVICCVEKD